MAPEVEPDPNLIALGGPEGTLGMVMGAMNRGWHYGACQKKKKKKKKEKVSDGRDGGCVAYAASPLMERNQNFPADTRLTERPCNFQRVSAIAHYYQSLTRFQRTDQRLSVAQIPLERPHPRSTP